MKTLIVYFSHSGNNRLLAEHLARRIGCDSCPIVEVKRRTLITIMLDMMFKRLPRIRPLACTPADYDHIVLIAPIWGSMVAHPMKSFIQQEKAALSSYSFISLCGYDLPDQREAVTRELAALAGHPPDGLTELKVSDLLPEQQRSNVGKVSRYRVGADELGAFEAQISEFCAHLAGTEPS